MSRAREQPDQDRHRLADVLLRRAGEIEQRWLDMVRRILGRDDISRSDLRNSMPDYLERLADGLRQPDVEAGGLHSWENVAREHAETRVRLGFDIDQVVREFIILRQVLFQVIDEDGMLLDIEQTGRLADLIDGAITAAVKSYVESRDYEARRRQAEHVGFVTHELRNPLTSAMLGTVQLRRLLSESLTPDQERTFLLIERNLRRLGELIDGVLIVERGTHALKPHLTVMSLGQLLDEPLAAAALSAESKRLRFEVRIDHDLLVQVDPKLALSAVDNVVQNAIKYTDAGEIDIETEDTPRDVVIHIRDTGPGLSKEELRTIFEPFHRGDSRKPGSGLGLAIARRAVDAQGGSIQAESGAGGGSHFWIKLPKPRH